MNRQISIYDITEGTSPDELLRLIHEYPHLLQQFQSHDPELASVLSSGVVASVRSLMMRRQMSKHKVVYDRRQEHAKIEADPMNADNQRRIAEEIRLANVRENMELAMEEMPEVIENIFDSN